MTKYLFCYRLKCFDFSFKRQTSSFNFLVFSRFSSFHTCSSVLWTCDKDSLQPRKTSLHLNDPFSPLLLHDYGEEQILLHSYEYSGSTTILLYSNTHTHTCICTHYLCIYFYNYMYTHISIDLNLKGIILHIESLMTYLSLFPESHQLLFHLSQYNYSVFEFFFRNLCFVLPSLSRFVYSFLLFKLT